ncbi:MAG: right-handed parallel beta-helix repeat-containing protein [Lachnospiraceae bacterium]|nr:right-handed parallel beta-helix repeat-containing protein [Lachnospiraceae bacterium]
MRRKMFCGSLIAVLCAVLALCGCGKKEAAPPQADKIGKAGIKKDQNKDKRGTYDVQIHVSSDGDDAKADGSEEKPYATIPAALAAVKPGTEVVVHEGQYDPFEVGTDISGTEEKPVLIRAEDDEAVVIKTETPADKESEGDCIGIHLVNAEYIAMEGFEIEGGTHGIFYESTRDRGDQPLNQIAFRNCTVHGVRGTHGICVYARNDLAPVKDLTMAGCEVYDCECGDSESAVFNGNIDGLEICDNIIHENNNIGIDMIGFEGTAKHPDDYKNAKGEAPNPYEFDFVRNGTCHDNVVYGISAEGNDAYLEDGEYDLCADGIYVDGGQDIEIYNNFIFDCDIGLEVATEHSPEDNELFKVSGIEVHDNVIADCTGWCGICFGGYDADLGFTEKCSFHNNTLVDNDTQIGIQRSKDNEVYYNLVAGGCTGVEFNEDCRQEDMVNKIHDNAAAEIEETDSWDISYGRLDKERGEIIEDFRSRFEGIGSGFSPGRDELDLYNEWNKR